MDENDFRVGDSHWDLLRKILGSLQRLSATNFTTESDSAVLHSDLETLHADINSVLAAVQVTALTPAAPGSVSVSNAVSTVLVAENANRKGLIISNNSGNSVSIAFGTAAVANKGLVLPNGGVFSMNEFSFTTAAVNAIVGGITPANVAFQEFS